MKINYFLKKISSDIKTNNRDYTRDDFYYILKYVGVKQDISLASDIEKFYQEFLDSLNDSLVKYETRKVKANENTTNYIGFYVDKKANYLEAAKVYFPVKYEYMISALKSILLYLIRNNIASVVKFHEKSTNENIVIKFYNSEDIIPFVKYCNSNFVLNDLLINPNPFIATSHGLGIVRDNNKESYNETLSILLEEYFKYLKIGDALDRASDLDFLDFIMRREETCEDDITLYNMKAIEENVRSILMERSPLR